MTTLRIAAQQALEALKLSTPKTRGADDDYAEQGWTEHNTAIAALRAALAQEQAEPEQEPVAWLYEAGTDRTLHWHKPPLCGTPLYTTPPQRQPLTEEEIKDCFHAARNAKLGASKDNSKHRLSVVEIARAVERAHGIIGSEIRGDKA